MVFRAPVWQVVRAALLFSGNSDIIYQAVSNVKHFFTFLKAFKPQSLFALASLLAAKRILSLLTDHCKHFFEEF